MRLALVVVLAALLAAGCGSKKPIEVKSPALESAERLEQRGAAAYAKGDHVGAFKDFELAAAVYASLAMTDAQAHAELSLARIDAEDGRAARALERINQVTAWAEKGSSIGTSTLLLAHGRAAAVYMQQKNAAAADTSLTKAEGLCASACDAAAALSTMRANWLFASGDLVAAKTKAASALALAATPSDKASALRSLAQIGLAQNDLVNATQNASDALKLDQALGASLRVIADLDLLAQIHNKAGNAAKAAEFLNLRDAASAARAHLGQK